MRWHCEDALSSTTSIRDVALHFQVQLVDRRFQKRGRRKHRTDHVRAMLTADLGIHTYARIFLLQLAGEFSQMARREQVMRIQTGSHVFGCARYISRLRRDVDGRVARQ